MTDVTDAAPAETQNPIKPPIDWWGEVKGIFWLILAVLGFHSFVAKPFYIPSESMMPGLLVGDRLVVTKYPYGYSYVSPTFHLMPETKGRLFGRLPERGDVVIAVPNGGREDYIKRVIGLPGDRIELRNGTLIINGVTVKRSAVTMRAIPVDSNSPCKDLEYPGLLRSSAQGTMICEMPSIQTMAAGLSLSLDVTCNTPCCRS